ncbi:NUDIX domain-containing protein [Halobacteria archaeon AArc-curdl1]|uniref:NUDIX domain-containing protein n=1 Tax=Natronosalvus hydrolyticus TaxID=2979988 RepID=A0AAP2Z838_9EURY|nr:NUDIX domain-containing protein [Halobacteria archaeon AArc-curdl1]
MGWTIERADVSYCPKCGSWLTSRQTTDGPRPYCSDCALTLYRNPIPLARATVIDGDSVLLIEMGEGRDAGEWALPGGHIDAGESPRVAAARELTEETGVSVSPADLTLIGDGFLEFSDGESMVSFNYATSRAHTSGTVVAGDDAAAARYWTREELLASPPLLRASSVSQVLEAMDEIGRSRDSSQ